VGALDHAHQRLSHQVAVRRQTRHLTHQQERRVAQLHLLAGLHGQGRHLLRRHLGHQFADTTGDSYAILVKLLFPEHAGQHRAPELQLRRYMAGRRALVGALSLQPGCVAKIQSVDAGHGLWSSVYSFSTEAAGASCGFSSSWSFCSFVCGLTTSDSKMKPALWPAFLLLISQAISSSFSKSGSLLSS